MFTKRIGGAVALLAATFSLAGAATTSAMECDSECAFPPPAPTPSLQSPGHLQLTARTFSGATAVINMVALNPQPIPPGKPTLVSIKLGGAGLVSLNPQPIPPGIPPIPLALFPTLFASGFAQFDGSVVAGAQLTVKGSLGLSNTANYVALNPQPIPPGIWSVNVGAGALIAVG